MKRILIIALALMLVAGLTTAYAQDDALVHTSGSMRVEGYYDENFSDWNDGEELDEREYWDQRFRWTTRFTPAEGLEAHIRIDYNERNWGSRLGAADGAVGRATHGTSGEFHIDKSYLQIERELFMLRGGQQWNGFGITLAAELIHTGFYFKLKTPVVVELLYGKLHEGNGQSDTDVSMGIDLNGDGDFDDPGEGVENYTSGSVNNATTDDRTQYGLQVSYASEMFSVGTFFSEDQDRTAYDLDDDQNVWGLWAKANFGMFSFETELDVFGGEQEQGVGLRDIDYVGTQFYFLASVKLSDVFKIDGEFFWAQGTDEGVDSAAVGGTQEIQISCINDGMDDWVPETMSHLDGMYHVLPSWDIFEPWADSGVIAGQLSLEFTAAPGITLHGQMGYAQAEEEDLELQEYDKHWENSWWLAAGVSWSFMEAASLDVGLFYADVSFDGDDDDPRNQQYAATNLLGHQNDDGDDDDDAAWGLLAILKISF